MSQTETHLETRDVLAGAYRGRQEDRRAVTHSAEVDANGHAVRVLCGRIDPERLVDRFGSDIDAAPTCKRCLAALHRGN